MLVSFIFLLNKARILCLYSVKEHEISTLFYYRAPFHWNEAKRKEHNNPTSVSKSYFLCFSFVFFLFISFVCSFFLFQLKQNGNEWNGSTHFVLLKEERTTHTLLSRSFRSFPFPFAQFNSRLHFFSLQLNWSERRERGKRGVRSEWRENETQRKNTRKRVVFLFVFLSLVSRFHSLRSFHCKRAKQRERERDTTVDDS